MAAVADAMSPMKRDRSRSTVAVLRALNALIADEAAWQVVTAPVQRDVRHGELERAAVPAFGPESS